MKQQLTFSVIRARDLVVCSQRSHSSVGASRGEANGGETPFWEWAGGGRKPRFLISVLRACVCSQRNCDCCLCITVEVGSAGAEYSDKDSFPDVEGDNEEESAS